MMVVKSYFMVSRHIVIGKKKTSCLFRIGYSIQNRSSSYEIFKNYKYSRENIDGMGIKYSGRFHKDEPGVEAVAGAAGSTNSDLFYSDYNDRNIPFGDRFHERVSAAQIQHLPVKKNKL